MSRVTRFFVGASLFYLVLGVTIGILIIVFPERVGHLLAIHVHINLLGWVSMMIYGVAYHALPRFSGRPLYSDKMATFHLVLANTGLLGLIIFWPIHRHYWSLLLPHIFLACFAAIYAISVYIFVFNIWKTVFGKS